MPPGNNSARGSAPQPPRELEKAVTKRDEEPPPGPNLRVHFGTPAAQPSRRAWESPSSGLRPPSRGSSTARPENNPAADADAAISLMNQKQGESDEDAPRCPTPRGFVLGRCSLCGAMEEGAEGAAPAVAVGHETLRQGGDGDGGGDGVGDSDDYAASCPPHPRFVHGLCSRCGAKEEEDGGVATPESPLVTRR